MFKNRKLFLCLLILSILITIPAGCTSTTTTTAKPVSTSAAATTTANAPVTSATAKEGKIAMGWWGDTKRNEVYNKVIDLFEAANPKIKVDRPFGTFAEYFDKLSTQIAGGNAPDVIGMHQRYVSEYALRGALLPLQPSIDAGLLKTKDIPDSVLKAGYVGGKLYMITQGVTGSGLSYNTSIFDQLKVSYPDVNWTYDAFKTKMKELKTAMDAKGLKMWPSSDFTIDIYNFSYWVRANNQNLFTEDGKIGFTEAVATSWFQYWKDLRDQGLICDPATVTEYDGLPLEQSLFANNKVAVTYMAASQVGLYQKQVKDTGVINIVRYPHNDGMKNPEYLSGAYFTINAKSGNPNAAAMLIDFFVNNTEGQKVFKLEQGVPAATTAITAISSSLTDSEKKSLDFIQNQLVKNASPEPYPPTGYTEITSNYKTIAMSVAFGEKTPAQGAAALIKTCNEILSKK